MSVRLHGTRLQELVVVMMVLVVNNRPFIGSVLILKTTLDESCLVFFTLQVSGPLFTTDPRLQQIVAVSECSMLAFPTSVRKNYFLQEGSETGPLGERGWH